LRGVLVSIDLLHPWRGRPVAALKDVRGNLAAIDRDRHGKLAQATAGRRHQPCAPAMRE
jgi:hypothetical protein